MSAIEEKFIAVQSVLARHLNLPFTPGLMDFLRGRALLCNVFKSLNDKSKDAFEGQSLQDVCRHDEFPLPIIRPLAFDFLMEPAFMKILFTEIPCLAMAVMKHFARLGKKAMQYCGGKTRASCLLMYRQMSRLLQSCRRDTRNLDHCHCEDSASATTLPGESVKSIPEPYCDKDEAQTVINASVNKT